MNTIAEKLEQLGKLNREINLLKKEIAEHKDGYIYKVCIRSYGSVSWQEHFNPYTIQNIVDEYGDGYDGLVEVYTNNPDLKLDSYGCLTELSLEELPEEKNISKSQAFVNNAILGLNL
jgi:hypothetical protein